MASPDRLRILLVSPYHGGSHASWAEGLQRHSHHDVDALTLPDRFWKWRMHGGAATLARRFLADQATPPPDLIVATDMLDLTTFLALTRRRTAGQPAILYMHENQLTYPLPDDPTTGPMRRQAGERDHHYAFINFASMLAADHVAFNSTYHREVWFDALPRFLRHFPEHNELATVDGLLAKCSVLPVGIECADGIGGANGIGGADGPGRSGGQAGAARPQRRDPATPPLLLWNQRWEYDKNPEQLVAALREVAERGADFRLAICGQAFSQSPPAFDGIEELFGERLVHVGFAEPPRYRELLLEADVTVSTAAHEFFGVAVLEAMAHGAFAVLPRRLAYPEILEGPALDAATRARVLYDTHDELVEHLLWALENRQESARIGAALARNAARYRWSRVIGAYDTLFEQACGNL